jgi:hypothetical protein
MKGMHSLSKAVGAILLLSGSLPSLAQLSVTVIADQGPCYGVNQGSATAQASGGIEPYTYAWVNDNDPEEVIGTGPTITNLPEGNYTVTVTDAQSATASATASILDLDPLVVRVAKTDVFCAGGATAFAQVRIGGGAGPYSILWSTGVEDEFTITGLSGGDYWVDVTDNAGCAHPRVNFTVEEPEPLTVTAEITAAACDGSAGGSIDVTIAGGTPDYLFYWEHGAGSLDLTNVAPGSYTIHVTDDNGCETSQTFEVPGSGGISVTASGNSPVCFGTSINLSASTTTPSVTYAWSGPGNFNSSLQNPVIPNATPNNAGTYTVTVTTPQGCTATASVDVVIYPNLAYSNGGTIGGEQSVCGPFDPDPVYSITLPQAPAGFDLEYLWIYTTSENVVNTNVGTLGVDWWMSSGTDPMSYDPEAITQTTWYRRCSRVEGCIVYSGESNWVKKEVRPVPSVVAGSNSPVCQATTISLSATVTEAGLTFAWTGPNNFSSTQQNPSRNASLANEGEYTVTVTNAAGCTASSSVMVDVYPYLLEGGTIAADESHCGPFDPAPITNVTLPPSSPYGELEYLWVYTTNPLVPVTPNMQTMGNMLPAGSTDPMSFDPGPITQTTWYRRCARIAGCGGYYGESNWVMKEVHEVPTVAVQATHVLCHGDNTGSISATPSGNAGDYHYSWMGPDGFTADTRDISELTAGVYVLEITHSETGCTASASIEVLEPTALEMSETHTSLGCTDSGASIDITVSGGVSPYVYSWSNGSTDEDQSGLEAGTYEVEVTDANGCTIGLAVTIERVNPLVCTIETPDYRHPVCGEYQFNTLNAHFSGGTGAVEMNWTVTATDPGDASNWTIYSGQGTSSIIFGAGKHPAVFTLTVTDEAGCVSTCTYEMPGCRANYFCTYTQGAYGHDGKKICTPDGASTINEWMQSSLPVGSSQYFGVPALRRYFELKGTDISHGNIFAMLPGGGPPRPLTGYATFDRPETWYHVPLESRANQRGKIKNILLSQAITLWLNMSGNEDRHLADLRLEGQYMITAEMKECGQGFAVPYQDMYTIIPQRVLSFLNDEYSGRGGATVGNLMDLANRMLGADLSLIRCWKGRNFGDFVWPSDVVKALDAINRGFDECRILIRFTNDDPEQWAHRDGYKPTWAGAEEVPEEEFDPDQLGLSTVNVTSYPNPFVETATIEFSVRESGQARLEVLSPNGSKVETLFDSEVRENEHYTVQFTGEVSGLYLYRLITPTETKVGKMVSIQR